MSLATFKPEIWALAILASLRNKSVGEFFVNHNYEGDIRDMGSTVKINSLNDVTVKTYTPGSQITYDELNTVSQELRIDHSDYAAIKLDDVDAVQCSTNLMSDATSNIANGILQNYDKFIFKLLTDEAVKKATNMVGTDVAPIDVTSDSNKVVDALIDVITIANKNNIPEEGRVVAVGPAVAGAIMKADKRNITPKFAEFISRGYIGNMYGVEIFTTNNLAQSSGRNDLMILTNPAMNTVANQLSKVEALRSETMFADLVRTLHMYGGKALYADGVVGAYVKTTAGE